MTTLSDTAATTLGALTLSLSTGAVVYAARILVRRLCGSASAAVQWVALFVGSAWLLVALSSALLFSGCLHAGVAAAAALAIAAGCRRWLGPPAFAELWQPTVAAGRAIAAGPGAAIVAACAFMLVFAACRGLLTPPLSWDSLTYHVPVPAFWVQHGGYWQWDAPDAFRDYSHYPANGELFVAWLLLPFGRDLLLNLTNLPFLAMGAMAVLALARELGAKRHDALLAAALVMLAPPSFAYATTQYVDCQSTAEVLAGWLFVLRFRRTAAAGDAALASAAFGLAIGTKHLALVTGSVAAVALTAMLVQQRLRRQPIGRAVAAAVLCGLAVAAPWYLRNWIETGNPLFPFAVHVGDLLQWPGSDNQLTTVDQGPKFELWLRLLSLQPGLMPLTFGPQLFCCAAVGCAGVIAGALGRPRFVWLALGAAVAADLAVYVSPGMRVLRDYWGDVSQRFLLVPFALLAAAGAGATSRLRGPPRIAALSVIAFLVVWNVAAIHVTAGAHDDTLATMATMAALTLAGGGCCAVRVAAAAPKWRWTAAAAGGLAALAALGWLQSYRERTRHDFFAHGVDLHGIPRHLAAAWEELDQPEQHYRIAFTAGWSGWGHHWLVYPMLGSRLQNELVYVPWTADPAAASYSPRHAARPATTPGEWIGRLRAARADVLFVMLPPPPELEWAEAHPEVFRLRASTTAYRIYDLLP